MNEMVLEEESDELEGDFTSHFSFYCKAFDEIVDDKAQDFDHVFQFRDLVKQDGLTYPECKFGNRLSSQHAFLLKFQY